MPGASATFITGINARGELVGYYDDTNSGPHGFIDNNGKITTINAPGAYNNADTILTGINNRGEAVGYYIDSSGVSHGFTATPKGDTCADLLKNECKHISKTDLLPGSSVVNASSGHGGSTAGGGDNHTANLSSGLTFSDTTNTPTAITTHSG